LFFAQVSCANFECLTYFLFISLRATKTGSVCLRIKDDGVGLPPDYDIDQYTAWPAEFTDSMKKNT